MNNKKEYIQNVYQPFSKFNPLRYPQTSPSIEYFSSNDGFGYQGRRPVVSENENRYVAPIVYDEDAGLYYNQRPGWFGEATKSLSQGMEQYIFQDLYNR